MAKPTYFPAWFTGPEGERKKFNSEAEVPPGWFDPGSKVGQAVIAKAAAPAPEPIPAPEPAAPAAPSAQPEHKTINLTREQVIEALTEAGVEFKPADSLASLYAKLEAAAAQGD